jgi:hypothetical protein
MRQREGIELAKKGSLPTKRRCNTVSKLFKNACHYSIKGHIVEQCLFNYRSMIIQQDKLKKSILYFKGPTNENIG